jgi:hypothetical protein
MTPECGVCITRATNSARSLVLPAKRYAPFLAVILAQLVLVAVAPSKGKEVVAPAFAAGQSAAGGATGLPGQPSTAGSNAPSGAAAAGAAPGSAAGSTAPGTAGGPAGAGGSSTGASGGTRQARGASGSGAADTSRCATPSRQFLDYPQSPACVAHTTNPGATFAGVTGKTVNLVYFREKDNPVVKGLLQSQGIYSDPADQQRFLTAMETFINKRYELYGRRSSTS